MLPIPKRLRAAAIFVSLAVGLAAGLAGPAPAQQPERIESFWSTVAGQIALRAAVAAELDRLAASRPVFEPAHPLAPTNEYTSGIEAIQAQITYEIQFVLVACGIELDHSSLPIPRWAMYEDIETALAMETLDGVLSVREMSMLNSCDLAWTPSVALSSFPILIPDPGTGTQSLDDYIAPMPEADFTNSPFAPVPAMQALEWQWFDAFNRYIKDELQRLRAETSQQASASPNADTQQTRIAALEAVDAYVSALMRQFLDHGMAQGALLAGCWAGPGNRYRIEVTNAGHILATDARGYVWGGVVFGDTLHLRKQFDTAEALLVFQHGEPLPELSDDNIAIAEALYHAHIVDLILVPLPADPAGARTLTVTHTVTHVAEAVVDSAGAVTWQAVPREEAAPGTVRMFETEWTRRPGTDCPA